AESGMVGEHQLLRPGLCARQRWPQADVVFGHRQPAERRIGTGGTEHERHVRVRRKRGTPMKVVLKIGGVALENQETLLACVKAIKSLAEDGHQVVVVHGGGSALTRTLKK